MSNARGKTAHSLIEGGFTLLEVLVAFAILAFALAAAYGVFSDASRSVASGERYGQALALAESRLAAIDAAPPGETWDGSGEYEDIYRWTVETSPLPDTVSDSVPLVPVAVSVTVSWEDGGPVVLETIRLKARQ